jgi:ubiquinone/menaquinone biosynthesis C-methylase UbiE
VDIGCGDGALTYLLSKNESAAEVIGCDTEYVGIKLAREKIKELPDGRKIQFFNKSFKECEFLNNSIDVITMCDVIEHVENIEPLLQEIKRTCKKGGILINTTPCKWRNNILWDEHHVFEYTKETLNELLSHHFQKTNVTMFSPTFLYNRYHRFKVIYNSLYLLGLNPLRFNLGSTSHTMLFSVSYH